MTNGNSNSINTFTTAGSGMKGELKLRDHKSQASHLVEIFVADRCASMVEKSSFTQVHVDIFEDDLR